ncbi:MAG: hypothetical protein ACRC92_18775 [Peptostreptococcaceae bacterium]
MAKKKGNMTLTIFYDDDPSKFTTCCIVGKSTFDGVLRSLEGTFADSIKAYVLTHHGDSGEHIINEDITIKNIVHSERADSVLRYDVSSVILIQEHSPNIKHKGFVVRHRASDLAEFVVTNGFLQAIYIKHEERTVPKVEIDEDLKRLGTKNYQETKELFEDGRIITLRRSKRELSIVEGIMVAEFMQRLVTEYEEAGKLRVLN